MKNFHLLLFTFIVLSLISCSNDNDSNSKKNTVFGNIQLSGPDTSTIGNSLVVGNINLDGLSTTGTTKSVTLLDENTTIIDGEVNSTNSSNAFIIVTSEFTPDDSATAQKVISMTIVKNSVEFRYGCLTPSSSSTFSDCGEGLKVDKDNKKVIFNNTAVKNTESGTILTMDGIITWN